MEKTAIQKFFYPSNTPTRASIGLLLLRLVAGAAFVLHGLPKIQNPFAWMGPDSTIPGFLQFLAAFSEFGGGIAWILGLLCSLASIGMSFTMIVAVHMHMIIKGDPFVGREGSYELALLYLVISFLFILGGPGKFSLDYKIFGKKS